MTQLDRSKGRSQIGCRKDNYTIPHPHRQISRSICSVISTQIQVQPLIAEKDGWVDYGLLHSVQMATSPNPQSFNYRSFPTPQALIVPLTVPQTLDAVSSLPLTCLTSPSTLSSPLLESLPQDHLQESDDEAGTSVHQTSSNRVLNILSKIKQARNTQNINPHQNYIQGWSVNINKYFKKRLILNGASKLKKHRCPLNCDRCPIVRSFLMLTTNHFVMLLS